MEYDLNKICDEVCIIAKTIGKFLKEQQDKFSFDDVELKGARNYVTYIDKEAEQKSIELLSALIPNSGFLAEEETVEYVKRKYTWIIDPLDGTTNYVHRDKPYSVSIALMIDDVIVIGVVYDPVVDELFSAVKNEKAYLNNKPLKVTSKDILQNAYIGFGIPYHLDDKGEVIIQNAIRQFRKCSFRIKGSAAIEICDVACGRSDAYFHSSLSPWDVAAATLILETAGGKCTDFSGGNNFLFGKELVASNGKIHNEIMNHIINPS